MCSQESRSGNLSNRGYYGIALYQPKTEENWGTVMRSAHNFRADFIATIGERYRRQRSDTTDTARHTPVFHYDTLEDFVAYMSTECSLVAVEVTGDYLLPTFCHPEKAVYLFGGEDRSLPLSLLPSGTLTVRIDTNYCLNLAVCASIVMYDRHSKSLA